MRVVSAADGAVLRFPREEGELLTRVLGDVAEAMAPGGLDHDDPVTQRLFPSAYPDDPDTEAAFRELTESALRDERIARVQGCVTDVASAPTRAGSLELRLDAAGVDRWLRALNDVRLALGTRLGITEESEPIDPDDPSAGGRWVYGWLTMIQDELVQALSG